MKLHKNLLFGIIASVLCLCDASAAKNKSCPPGCFCIKEGRYQPGSGILNHKNTSDICKSSSYKINDAKHCFEVPGYKIEGGFSSETYHLIPYDYLYAKLEGKTYFSMKAIACTPSTTDQLEHENVQVLYYLGEFSDLYYSDLGSYGYIDNQLMYFPFYSDLIDIYACPDTFPLSNEGAKSLAECYTYDDKGQQIYYTRSSLANEQSKTSTDVSVNQVKALLEDLLISLAKVDNIATELDKVLNSDISYAPKAKREKEILSNINNIFNKNISDKVVTKTTTTSNTSQPNESSESSNDTSSSKKLDTLKKQISANMITPTKKASDKTMQNKSINGKSAVRF